MRHQVNQERKSTDHSNEWKNSTQLRGKGNVTKRTFFTPFSFSFSFIRIIWTLRLWDGTHKWQWTDGEVKRRARHMVTWTFLLLLSNFYWSNICEMGPSFTWSQKEVKELPWKYVSRLYLLPWRVSSSHFSSSSLSSQLHHFWSQGFPFFVQSIHWFFFFFYYYFFLFLFQTEMHISHFEV